MNNSRTPRLFATLATLTLCSGPAFAVSYNDGGTHIINTNQAGNPLTISNATTVNVVPGGGNIGDTFLLDTSVYNGLSYDNSTLTINADGSSEVNLSGGEFAKGGIVLNDNSGTDAQLNISGGNFNDELKIHSYAQSTINISSGTFNDYVHSYSIGTTSETHISGGEFNEFAAIYGGKLLNISGGDFTGTPYIDVYSSYADHVLDSTTIISGGEFSTMFLDDRSGQSVEISGGTFDNAEITVGNVDGGGNFIVSGGDFDQFEVKTGGFRFGDPGSLVTVTGGTFGEASMFLGYARANGDMLNISGGQFEGAIEIDARRDAVLHLSGGEFQNDQLTIDLLNASEAFIYGHSFFLDGVPVGLGVLDLGVDGTGVLSGIFADGSAFYGAILTDGSTGNFTLATAIPEPTSLALLGLTGTAVMLRRRSA